MLTFFYSPGSSSMAPHIALHEIGAPFEAKCLSLSKKDQKDPAYLAMNPEGKVPLLLVDGRPMTEVAGIMFYLAKAHPQAKLLPEDAEGQGHVVSWMSYAASSLHPARKAGVDVAKEVFGRTDKRLAGREWFAGSYSIADIHVFRLFWKFTDYASPARADYPNLFAHYDRMMARPAVQKTIEIESQGIA